MWRNEEAEDEGDLGLLLVDAVLDGGACEVGLESTIIGLDGSPRLLRPGGLPSTAPEAALGAPLQHHAERDALNAPGQLPPHSAPVARARPPPHPAGIG